MTNLYIVVITVLLIILAIEIVRYYKAKTELENLKKKGN